MTNADINIVMSDMDINKAVADSLRVYWFLSPDRGDRNLWEYCEYYGQVDRDVGEYEEALPDYCNNPNDIMPIIFANKISLHFNRSGCGLYTAIGTKCPDRLPGKHSKNFEVSNQNPLSAAAIVFLMMQEAK